MQIKSLFVHILGFARAPLALSKREVKLPCLPRRRVIACALPTSQPVFQTSRSRILIETHL
ncbi:MAG TPA: hypothetical protein DCK93_02300 [Blastocatellia bacterium]|nr:hypothetical protein [Blastocatellia bacterium]HAF21735.1 hypothetical protein [Blastocatellia bacterium]